ncbi:hypothetical protein DFP96_102142 [Listeria rocourtiae]|uniref:Uncharacterized protein n=1 Tax=Listeria rocourtiae TaxID=647910 RepID=A0A4V3DQ25_9LIST|nr:hypothetical protein PROCOU_15464 [Listeria rocourtiae FSL F6-920]TDR54556.1 hypothetical protein DFP96_102142 [Listeria rocourtiae]
MLSGRRIIFTILFINLLTMNILPLDVLRQLFTISMLYCKSFLNNHFSPDLLMDILSTKESNFIITPYAYQKFAEKGC